MTPIAQALSSTAASAVSIPNIPSILGWLNNPMIAMICGALGGSALLFLHELRAGLGKVISFLGSSKGQALEVDATGFAAWLKKTLADAGHPEPDKVSATIDGILAQLPAIAKMQIPKMILVLFLGSLLWASQAKAGISFGEISISPTASGAPTYTVQPSIDMAFAKVNGGILNVTNDKVVGMDFLINWGNYYAGFEGAYDYDPDTQISYLCGGIVAGVAPYGSVGLLWRENAAMLGYAWTPGIGAQTTN